MRTWQTALIVFAMVVIASVYVFEQDYASKREWSVVQAAEMAGRNQPIQERIQYYNDHEFGSVIGILDFEGRARVWVLGNAKYGERLKILPTLASQEGLRVRITPTEFESIKDRVSLSDDVKEFLANSVQTGISKP
jgi:hypothetical protein